MIDERYERLGMLDKEKFGRIVNYLLAHTFLLAEEYDFAEGITRVNKDYLFAERNYDLLQEYLSMAGFGLERDSGYGVISIVSSYDGNRVRFDKFTTILVYALRLIYEEEREKLTLTREVMITTGELIQKLFSLGTITKKPANNIMHDAMRTLSKFRIIAKREGIWEAPETRILILPTILFIVSNEQISNLSKLLDSDDTEENIEDTDQTYAEDEGE